MPISLPRRLFGRLCVFFVLLCTPLFALPTYAQSSVAIGEVQWAGSEKSSADEWIELWNLSNTPFSLNGFRLRGVGSGSDIVFGLQDQIEPEGAFLLSNYRANDLKSTLTFSAQIVTTTLSVTNENTAISLVDPNGVMIDEVQWGKTAPGGSAATPRSSMVRIFDTDLLSSSWISATTTKNLDPAIQQYGTPGLCDACQMTVQIHPPPNSPTTTTFAAEENIISSPLAKEDASTTTPFLPPSLSEPLIVESPSSSEENVDSLSQPEDAPTTDAMEDTPDTLLTENPVTGQAINPLPPIESAESAHQDALIASPIATAVQDTTPESTSTETIPDTAPISTSTSDLEIPLTRQSTTTPPLPLEPLMPPISTSSVTTTERTTVTQTQPEASPTEDRVILPLQKTTRASFHEVFPSPTTGSEWIELRLDTTTEPKDLFGMRFVDAHKTILAFTPSTPFTWNEELRLLVLSRRNGGIANSGATLKLIMGSGLLLDELHMPRVPRNHSWALDTQGHWQLTATTTPGKENRFTLTTAPTPSTNVIASEVTTQRKTSTIRTEKSEKKPKLAPSRFAQTPKPTEEPASSLKTSRPRVQAQLTNRSADHSSNEKSPKKKKPKNPTSNPVKKNKKIRSTRTLYAPKQVKTKAPLTLDLATLGAMHASTRVRLIGTVAAPPRLLGNHAFVIQTDDGRGLYVVGNNKQPSPPFHAQVALTGTLSLNDDGLILHMYASDRWKLLELERAVQPREPDLDHPSLEDAWSYVQLRGTVINVNATHVTLLHNQTEMDVSVRPSVPYRTARLKKGDEIEVSGLLDTRKETPAILPRVAEEIRLLKSAAPTSVSERPATAPLPWMPVGVAGMSIAATQGVRRYWKYRLEQRIRLSQPHS